jgi:chromosome segregation ATPase
MRGLKLVIEEGGEMTERIEALRKKIEQAKLDLARAQERLQKSKEDLAKIEKEIQDAGCTPDTIDQEIERLEKDLEANILKLEGEMSGIDETVKNGGGGGSSAVNDAISGFDD